MSYDDGAHSQQKCSGVEVNQISNEDCCIPSASATSFSNRVSFVIGLYIGFIAVYVIYSSAVAVCYPDTVVKPTQVSTA